MSIQKRLKHIQQQIAALCVQSGRATNAASLLVVSKQRTISEIKEAVVAGQMTFAENQAQEALIKIQALTDYPIEWHFIGPIQSNKTKMIAEHFAWVHSVSRLSIAKRLSQQRPESMPPLNICLQVNISGEASKSGVLSSQVLPLAQQLVQLPQLTLRGLMAIPAPTQDVACQRRAFRQLADLYAQVRQAGLHLDTLSMGMSNDFPAAIAEGATVVRVGTAIFGSREKV